MKNLVKITAIGSAMAAASMISSVQAADLTAVPSGQYQVDPTHAYINFQYNHLGLSNPTLSFDDFTVDLNLNNENAEESMIMVEIDTDSVITGSAIWKEHLTGGDWLDTANNPQATFMSTDIESTGDSTYKVTGDLTLKGVTKPVTLDVTVNGAMNHPMSGKPVIGIDASGTVLRSDFGLDKFAPNISDEVKLNISAELTKSE